MSDWNHNMCWSCWRSTYNDLGEVRRPIRIVTGTIEELEDMCCFCNRINLEGIYCRHDPKMVPCGGRHKKGGLEGETETAKR